MPLKFTETVLEEFKREAHLRTAKEHADKYGSTQGLFTFWPVSLD
jgi:hypothetical protein